MNHPVGKLSINKIYEYARDSHLFTDEDKFLDSITGRQDLCINMTQLETDAICTGLIEPDTLMRDNNRQTLRCHYGAETNIQAIHQRV